MVFTEYLKFFRSRLVSSLFYLHPKEQLILIENKIEQKLQIERWQLNNICYNIHKKNLAWPLHH